MGQAIEELGKSFRDLAYSPVTAVFGEIEFPHIMSASIVIKGREGRILCSFAINLANLKIGEKLEEMLHELERQSNEAKEFDRTIDSVLSLLAAGFVVINGKGIVLPGFSGSVPAIVGLPPTVDIEGEVLPDIIGIPEHMHPEWEQLLTKVFTISGETPFEATAGHHAPIEFTNVRNRRLKLTGCPLAGNGDTPPARLLIVIEDAASP